MEDIWETLSKDEKIERLEVMLELRDAQLENLNKKYNELQSKLSWIENPDQMGK